MTLVTNAPNSQQPFVDPAGRMTRIWLQWLLGIVSAATTGGTVTNTGVLTDHHVILGNGGVDIKALSGIGSNGQVLTSNGAGADPTFQNPATSGTVTHTGTLTSGQVVYGNGGADIHVVAATNGQIPIGKTSDGTAAFATLTAGTGIAVTNGANSITIATVSSGDFVVMSDGHQPPTAMDDGAGQFLYVAYTP